MKHRFAEMADIPTLAKMNRELTEDENHRNRFQTDAWFQQRMQTFLNGDYHAVIFGQDGKILAYALYRNHPEYKDTIYLRQIFVDRDFRRQGIGRQAMQILMNEYWSKEKRLTVEVLSDNITAYAFYKSVGYRDYSLELEIKPDERM